jgi:signal transduction histidine kinase
MDQVEGNTSGQASDSVLFNVPSLVAAAHELKPPRVLLRQLTFQLEQELSPTSDKNIRQTIDRMRLTTERTLRLCDNLTKTARLDDALFAMEPVHLTNLMGEVVRELSPLGHALNQKIIMKSKPRKPIITIGNREILHTLFASLIDNALQYNREKRPVEVRTRLLGHDTNCRIIVSVRDHGTVMDLSEFRKLSSTIGKQATPIATRPLSSGLGLFIASKFTTALGGSLSLQRHFSGGLTFSVNLPLVHQLSLLESI